MHTLALLALEDGTVFHGVSVGIDGISTGEVVFNTAMTGYQEILTDPSYCKQIITLTYPHIGNVGTNSQDQESDRVWASGLVIRDLSQITSSWRAQLSLSDYLKEKSVVGIANIDTRMLTRILRDKGAQNGCIMAGDNLDESLAIKKAQSFPGLQGLDLAKEVTTATQYEWKHGSEAIISDVEPVSSPIDNNKPDKNFHIVAYDFGVKHNILRLLKDRDCRITVVPAQTPADKVLALQPDAVFLSNGPGDPEPCNYAHNAIKELLAKKLPIFGICLGHQLLALACGAKTHKMKFGHHGANHPVQNLSSGEVLITSQNHGFAVAEQSLPDQLIATHRSLFDGTLQGIKHMSLPAMGFQGHPEASPGPQDIAKLFDTFIDLIDQHN